MFVVQSLAKWNCTTLNLTLNELMTTIHSTSYASSIWFESSLAFTLLDWNEIKRGKHFSVNTVSIWVYYNEKFFTRIIIGIVGIKIPILTFEKKTKLFFLHTHRLTKRYYSCIDVIRFYMNRFLLSLLFTDLSILCVL